MPTTAREDLVLVVACALVDSDGRVLIAQRPPGKAMAGLWEFPGGKLAAGETPGGLSDARARRGAGHRDRGACLAPLTFASHAYPDFHLLMPLYVCRIWRGQPAGARGPGAALGAAAGSCASCRCRPPTCR